MAVSKIIIHVKKFRNGFRWQFMNQLKNLFNFSDKIFVARQKIIKMIDTARIETFQRRKIKDYGFIGAEKTFQHTLLRHVN